VDPAIECPFGGLVRTFRNSYYSATTFNELQKIASTSKLTVSNAAFPFEVPERVSRLLRKNFK
jgi:hypothetical protein